MDGFVAPFRAITDTSQVFNPIPKSRGTLEEATCTTSSEMPQTECQIGSVKAFVSVDQHIRLSIPTTQRGCLHACTHVILWLFLLALIFTATRVSPHRKYCTEQWTQRTKA